MTMASLSLSITAKTCFQTSTFIHWVSVPFCKQTIPLKICKSGRLNYAHKPRNAKVFSKSHNSIEQIHPGSDLNYNAEKGQRAFSYLFRTEIGGLVKVLVGFNNMKYAVHIDVSSLPTRINDLILSWGLFRSDSYQLDAPGYTKTPFVQNSKGRFSVTLEFSSTQIPLYLSFLLHSSSDHPRCESGIRTHRMTNFCVPVGMSAGHPMPLGVSRCEDGSVNFALFSRNAESVVLCLFDNNVNEPCLEIELDPYVNRTGDIWHLSMENVGNYISYGYRCKGETGSDKGSRFQARQVLLDPYAKLIANVSPEQGESRSLVKCLGSLAEEPIFYWSGDVHPQLPMEKLVVYHLNVGNFTEDESSELPENVAGAFAGVIEKLPHLKSLGVNAILLEPIFTFDEKEGPYFPYHFFSPMNSYGSKSDSISTVNSMKDMVKTLHAHGIEVLLEVVFTHTGEGGDSSSQTISFQGIDNSSYYIVEGDMRQGIYNAVNSNNPVVQQLILESLRYWLTEFHVDGFCFINSSYLLRGSNGEYISRPPLVEAIAFDPLLSKSKIIADCWSPVDGSYLDIHFPHWNRWAEMNTRFCRDVRNFLRGEGLLSDLATRLCGSGDLFSDSRGPAFSFNYVTKNFRLPLVDLVSFSRDELASELSWNCGEEGPTNNNSVLEIRLRQIRNFLFLLFISLGVPVLNMGDECGFSTGGLSSYGDRHPIDWNVMKSVFGKQITQFITFLSSLRIRRNDIFQRRDFLKVENIDWHGSNLSQPKWEDPSCKFLAVTIRADKDDNMSTSYKGDLFICFNADDFPEIAVLPQLPEGHEWFRLVDTSLPFPGFFSGESVFTEDLSGYELKPHSCALFEVKKSAS